MTDLHCHILPGIDDGAQDVEASVALLKMEMEQGVDKVVFTPHFNCDEMPLEEFLRRRQKAYDKLMAALPSRIKNNMEFKLGAEVYFSPTLSSIDLAPLCISGTSYILIELPFVNAVKPTFLSDVLYDISSQGITPIIAHVERYPYILSDPTQIYHWVTAGYVIQVNAKTICQGDRMVKNLVEWGLVQIIASDAHSPKKRPVLLKEAYGHLRPDMAKYIKQSCVDVFDNYEIDVLEPHRPKKVMGRWK